MAAFRTEVTTAVLSILFTVLPAGCASPPAPPPPIHAPPRVVWDLTPGDNSFEGQVLDGFVDDLTKESYLCTTSGLYKVSSEGKVDLMESLKEGQLLQCEEAGDLVNVLSPEGRSYLYKVEKRNPKAQTSIGILRKDGIDALVAISYLGFKGRTLLTATPTSDFTKLVYTFWDSSGDALTPLTGHYRDVNLDPSGGAAVLYGMDGVSVYAQNAALRLDRSDGPYRVAALVGGGSRAALVKSSDPQTVIVVNTDGAGGVPIATFAYPEVVRFLSFNGPDQVLVAGSGGTWSSASVPMASLGPLHSIGCVANAACVDSNPKRPLASDVIAHTVNERSGTRPFYRWGKSHVVLTRGLGSSASEFYRFTFDAGEEQARVPVVVSASSSKYLIAFVRKRAVLIQWR